MLQDDRPSGRPNRWRLLLLVAVLSLLVGGRPASAAIIFFDDTFADADWNLTSFVNNAGSTLGVQQAAGGNLGAFRKVTTNVGPAPIGHAAQILGFHRNLFAMFDPAALGAITSLDYSEDAIMLNGFGDGQASGPALRQNGQVYIRYAVFAKDANWTPKGFAGLTQNSFSLVNLSDTTIVDGTQHPDFSAGGSLIDFGFFRFNATCISCGAYSIVAGIDNWRIQINQPNPEPEPSPVVPEPSSVFLLGSGILGLVGWTRRRAPRSS